MTRRAIAAILELTLWRIREFTREPEALFWVFAFPIVLAFALGLAFKSRGPEVVRVAVEAGAGGAALADALNAADRVEAVLLDSAEAHERLRTGRVAIVVRSGDPLVLRYDSTRTESDIARLVVGDALQEAAGRRDVAVIRDVRVTEPGARYIDFLIPGLIGLNIMGTGMWGIGFGIVKARNDKLLKRLLASPMRKSDFMLSFMLARLFFLGFEVGAVLLFGYLMFGVPVRGSVLAIAAIVVLGAMAFSGLGLLVASRARTIEGVSGLMNLVMVPMWILSGVFFAYSHFPEGLQPFIRPLPLTALNDALRAVLLDGAPLLATAGFLGLLVVWGGLSFGVALRIFRWH
jgi:ABC-type multidrug transport system permease subunit